MPAPTILTIDDERIYNFDMAHAVQQRIAAELAKDQVSGVVVDLSRVAYVCSPFMGVLVACSKDAEQRGKRLALCGMQGIVRGLFGLIQLDHRIPTFTDASAAVAGLS